MLEKIRDFMDEKFYFLILMNDLECIEAVTNSIKESGQTRFRYVVYKESLAGFKYMVELKMPYNRYLPFMTNLRKRGYTLRDLSLIGVISVVEKI